MVDDHDSRPGLGDALGFHHQLVRIADHADHVTDEDVVERVTPKGEPQRVGLKDRGVGEDLAKLIEEKTGDGYVEK